MVPIPANSGRCIAHVLTLTISFEAGTGWLWGSTGAGPEVESDGTFTTYPPAGFALTLDGIAAMYFYQYGGAVVPAYCEDPPPTVAIATASEILTWLATVDGLEVRTTNRSLGPYRAWQLDLRAVSGHRCSPDPGKGTLVSLWTIAGMPIELPQVLEGGAQMRAYLIELPDRLIIATVSGPPEAYAALLGRAERVFASLAFE